MVEPTLSAAETVGESNYSSETIVDLSKENENENSKEFLRLSRLRKEFQLEESEKLLESCSAALVRIILLQGRLYVTTRNIIFYSKIFGYVTRKKWAFHAIKDVRKRRGKFVGNSIKIEFQDLETTPAIFASLYHRNRTISVISSQLSSRNPGFLRQSISVLDEHKNKFRSLNDKEANEEVENGVVESEFDQEVSAKGIEIETGLNFKEEKNSKTMNDTNKNDENPTISDRNEILGEEFGQIAPINDIEKNVAFEDEENSTKNDEPSSIQSSEALRSPSHHARKHRRSRSLRLSFRNFMTSVDDDIDEALNSLFWKTKVDPVDTVFGRGYETKMEQARCTFDVPPIFVFNQLFRSDWILTYLSETNNFELRVTDWFRNEEYGVMQREVSFVRPLTHRMGPKQTRVDEKQTYCFTSDGGVLVESEARNLDVPFGDNFWVESYFQLKPTYGGKKTEFIASIAIHFTKRTMLRGAIESATIPETKRSFEKLIELAAKQIEVQVPQTHVAAFLRRLRRPSLFEQIWDITKKLSLRES